MFTSTYIERLAKIIALTLFAFSAHAQQQRVDAKDVVVRDDLILLRNDQGVDNLAILAVDTLTGKVYVTSVESAGSLWNLDNDILWTPRNVTIGGVDTTVSAAKLYVYGGARIENPLTVAGNSPRVILLDENTLSKQEIVITGAGEMLHQFTSKLGVWNEPTESLDIPGTARMRGVAVGADTMQMVGIDDQGVLYRLNAPTSHPLIIARNDADADTKGVQIGEDYKASTDNTMGEKPNNTVTRIY